MGLSDPEDGNPKHSDADCGESNNASAEEKEHQEEEDDIVDRKNFGRHDQDVVDRLEDIDVTKQIAALSFAD